MKPNFREDSSFLHTLQIKKRYICEIKSKCTAPDRFQIASEATVINGQQASNCQVCSCVLAQHFSLLNQGAQEQEGMTQEKC